VKRQQLIDNIERGWSAFNGACEGLPDAAILATGTVGSWSVKDLMAHVATWEGEALVGLPIIMQGKRPPRYGGVDNFNARQYDRISHLDLPQAREVLQASHRRLLDFLAEVPEAWFETETRFRHRLRLDTWGHYPEHTEAILAWRKAEGL
jgi:DinB superfamily